MATHFRNVVHYTRSRTGIPLESHDLEAVKTRWKMSPAYVVIFHILAFYGTYILMVENIPLYRAIIYRWAMLIGKG